MSAIISPSRLHSNAPRYPGRRQPARLRRLMSSERSRSICSEWTVDDLGLSAAPVGCGSEMISRYIAIQPTDLDQLWDRSAIHEAFTCRIRYSRAEILFRAKPSGTQGSGTTSAAGLFPRCLGGA